MQQKHAESKKAVLIANQKKLDNWLQLRKEEYLLRVKDTSELDEIKDKYVNESDFRQKIALKKRIEILEEQKQKMIETFHDEMSTLEEEAVNMQKQFAEGVLVKTQLVTKIVIKFQEATMEKKGKLELTWVGKYEEEKLEPRILIEDKSK